jgi:fructuronate reductase
MTTLCLRTLQDVAAGVARPDYDPTRVSIGILHLGLGAFHRAHQAVLVDGMLAREPQWAIAGVSFNTPRAKELLAPQDGLYTWLEKSADATKAHVIGSVRESLFLGTDRARLMARFADPSVRIVTLTVTEKGYCHDPASGALDFERPEIVRDRARTAAPCSVPGVIVAGLAARRAANAGPLTLLCCDNLPHNGRVVEGIVHAFAAHTDATLARWIDDNTTFPSTMVDRIVPATTERDLVEARALIGMDDAAPVVSEPWFQWVMEDRFAAGRPAWEAVGVQLTADVGAFETMKLRLLNGSHSTLAYLGYLAGHEYIWEACSDHELGAVLERLMAEEVAPTVKAPPGVDLARYRAHLVERFCNPALPHRTRQIAMDGSQKLPQRLLQPVRERLAAGAPITHLALAIAGWIRYASGRDEQGGTIDVDDPLAPRFARIAADAQGDPARLAAGFLDLSPVFGDDLVRHQRFRAAVTGNVVSLVQKGVRATLATHLGSR